MFASDFWATLNLHINCVSATWEILIVLWTGPTLYANMDISLNRINIAIKKRLILILVFITKINIRIFIILKQFDIIIHFELKKKKQNLMKTQKLARWGLYATNLYWSVRFKFKVGPINLFFLLSDLLNFIQKKSS